MTPILNNSDQTTPQEREAFLQRYPPLDMGEYSLGNDIDQQGAILKEAKKGYEAIIQNLKTMVFDKNNWYDYIDLMRYCHVNDCMAFGMEPEKLPEPELLTTHIFSRLKIVDDQQTFNFTLVPGQRLSAFGMRYEFAKNIQLPLL